MLEHGTHPYIFDKIQPGTRLRIPTWYLNHFIDIVIENTDKFFFDSKHEMQCVAGAEQLNTGYYSPLNDRTSDTIAYLHHCSSSIFPSDLDQLFFAESDSIMLAIYRSVMMIYIKCDPSDNFNICHWPAVRPICTQNCTHTSLHELANFHRGKVFLVLRAY